METRKVRDTEVTLPGEGPEDLENCRNIPRDGTAVVASRISGAQWARASLTAVTISRCWLLNADLTAVRLVDVAWDRCVLRGCTLIGANVTGGSLKHVVFDTCRLDYATLHHLRAAGPVAFIGCSLIETAFDKCQLGGAVLDACRLAGTSLDECNLHRADLRGNDLSTLRGITSLRGAVLSQQQLPGLMEALVTDLELNLRVD